MGTDADKLIIVADDDYAIRETLKGILQSDGYSVKSASNGKEALDVITERIPDLVILDWSMPEMDGWSVCRDMRSDDRTKNIPVMMLTARATTEDEIIGLEAGADDYITKPFKADLLSARVKALLRRTRQEDLREISAAGIKINLDSHMVNIEGAPVDLWPKEFDLLYYLMKNADRAVDRDALLHNVWGYEYIGTTRAVDATVKRLRKKLGSRAANIETVKGIGYKFSPDRAT